MRSAVSVQTRHEPYRTANAPAGLVGLPEWKLWAAVLETALDDVYGLSALRSHTTAARERETKGRLPALAWFADEQNSVGTFHWICDVLDLDPNAVRRIAAAEDTRSPLWRYERRPGSMR